MKTADAETKQAGLHAPGEESCCADDCGGRAERHGSPIACSSSSKPTATATAAPGAEVQVPEIGRAEIAGEWLIPRDEILLIGFGPHTVADKDGKAVVRERLALISAEEVVQPTASARAESLELPRPVPRVAVSPSRLALPALPSRTLPQGVHADGTPAELPPLPEEDKADTSAAGSSDPRPSPQSHKPRPAPAAPASSATRPAAKADGRAAKAAFSMASNLLRNSPLGPLSFPSLQFMMPLKPLALRLPFNQKLELELIGRVVADPDASAEDGDNGE